MATDNVYNYGDTSSLKFTKPGQVNELKVDVEQEYVRIPNGLFVGVCNHKASRYRQFFEQKDKKAENRR